MPEDATLHEFQAALAHEQSGRHDAAQRIYEQIVRGNPAFAPAHYRLGLLARGSGNLQDALRHFQSAATLESRNPIVLGDYGLALAELGRIPEAIAAYRAGLQVSPQATVLLNNLGNALMDAGQMEQAIEVYRRAVQLGPSHAQIHNNLATALLETGYVDEAEMEYRRAIALRPNFPHAQVNLANLMLLRGEYVNGWAAYEARWQFDQARMHRGFRQPLWDGSNLDGRRILLHTEQGFGDMIQFIRYASRVKARGGRVMVLCPKPLRRLFSTVSGIDELYCDGDALPPFDVHCPLMSLPRVLGTTVQTIPADVPYVHADPQLIQGWQARMTNEPPVLKVGIAWSGRQHDFVNRKRSIPVDALGPLINLPGVRFYNLQRDVPPAAQLPAGIVNWAPDLHDFADTTALIAALDLVLSVDTAIAHLAGAMGKSTGILLPFACDWRWLLDRQDSPWYPTARLFRQRQRGDWAAPIEQVRAGLEGLVRSQSTASKARSVTEHANLGLAYAAQGQFPQAIEAFRAALVLQPRHARLHNDLGMALKNNGQLNEAVIALRRAAELAPELAGIHHNLGQAFYEQKQFAEAVSAMRSAYAIGSDDPEILHNLGKAMKADGALEEAATYFKRAIAVKPDFAKAYTSLGVVRREQGNDQAAIGLFRQAIEQDPQDPDPKRLLGLALLSRGEFEEGFPLYEAHRQMPEFRDIHDFSQPMWDGGALNGRTLLVYADGGFGDTIHMARYVQLIESDSRVIFECQEPLKRLLERSLPKVEIIARGEALPQFDLYCPTSSLPRVFRTTVATIPDLVPYLTADPAEVGRWKSRLIEKFSGRNVGLVWLGRPDPPGRSIPPELLGPLSTVPGIRFHSLAPREVMGSPGSLEIEDWSGDLRDFADTAALASCLDLVVTIDTAAAHLAGALARPVWTMLAQPADWRWLADRADTPWYRTMRLFRQPRPGDWKAVVEHVAAELAKFANSDGKSSVC